MEQVMTVIKLDKPLDDSLSVLVEAQSAIQRILDKRSAKIVKPSPRYTMELIKEAFNNVSKLAPIDNQAYLFFDSAFGKGSRLEAWSQKADLREAYTNLLAPINDISKEPRPIGTNAYKESKEDHYSFKKEIKSDWLQQQETTATESDTGKVKIANMVEDFIRDERTKATITAGLPIIFNTFLNDKKISEADKNIVKDYLDTLQSKRALYDKLNLHELLNPSTQSVEEVIKKLAEKYQTLTFETYQADFDDTQLKALAKKYPELTKGNDWMLNEQRKLNSLSLDYLKYFQSLQTELKKNEIVSPEINKAVQVAEARFAVATALANAERLLENKKSKSDIQQTVLAELVFKYPSFTPDDSLLKLQTQASLEHLLVAAYPDNFKQPKGQSFSSTSNEFTIALGGPIKESQHLDPQDFDLKSLQKLAPTQPLADLLIAMKPIDGTFHLADKITAYQQLALLAENGKIKISNQWASEQRSAIGAQALKIVEETMGKVDIKEPLAIYRELIEAAHTGKFKFNNEGASNQSAAIIEKYHSLLANEKVRQQMPLLDQVNEFKAFIDLINKNQLTNGNMSTLQYARSVAKELIDVVNSSIENNQENDTTALIKPIYDIYQAIEDTSKFHQLKQKLAGKGIASEIRSEYWEFLVFKGVLDKNNKLLPSYNTPPLATPTAQKQKDIKEAVTELRTESSKEEYRSSQRLE